MATRSAPIRIGVVPAWIIQAARHQLPAGAFSIRCPAWAARKRFKRAR